MTYQPENYRSGSCEATDHDKDRDGPRIPRDLVAIKDYPRYKGRGLLCSNCIVRYIAELQAAADASTKPVASIDDDGNIEIDGMTVVFG